MALSADGRKAALIPSNGGIHLIDVATGKETGKEFKPGGLIRKAVLSGDGGILATWSDHGLVQVWDAANGKLLSELTTVRKQDAFTRPQWLTLSADGKTLAWVGEDGACPIHIVDVTTGKELHKLEDHDGGQRQVVMSPNVAYLVASSSKGLVQLWDFKQGSVLRKWTGTKSDFHLPLAVFTPDGKKIVLNQPDDRNALRLIDIATGKDQWSIKPSISMSTVPDAYSISPDGKMLFRVWGGGSVVYRFEMETGKRILLPGEMSHAFRDVAFAADEATLFSSADDGVVRAWEVTTGKETRQVLSRTVVGMFSTVGMFSLHGGLIVNDTREGFELLEIATNRVRLRGEGSPVFSLDGRMVAAVGKKSIAILETATGKPISKLPGPPFPHCVRFAPDGKRLAVLAETAEGCVLRFWECGTGQELPSKLMPRCDTSTLLFSPDGRTVVVGSYKFPQGLLVVETATGQQRQQIRFDKILPSWGWLWPPNVAFTPGGECLLIGDGVGGVSFVDPLAGELLHRRQANGGIVSRMVFSSSGRYLATVGGDATVLVWNAADFLRPARPKPLKLLDAELSALWDDLASADGPKAAIAMRQLTRAGEPALNLLRERLPPATAVTLDAKRLKQWLDDLDDESFETRRQAEAEIEKLGEAARPALQKTAAGQPSEHVRRTIDLLIAKLDAPQLARPARSVEVLELIGTPAARDLLEKLAKGAPEARLTKEAQSSLARVPNKVD
jgi:WD40 repeat protein